MRVIKTTEYNDEDIYQKKFFFDDTVQLDSFISLIRQFENEQTKMSVCHCSTFNENDNELYRMYTSVDEIANFKNEPSPYATFSADFCDRNTLEYRFSVYTGINLKYMKYIVNKKKLLVNSNNGRSKK